MHSNRALVTVWEYHPIKGEKRMSSLAWYAIAGVQRKTILLSFFRIINQKSRNRDQFSWVWQKMILRLFFSFRYFMFWRPGNSDVQKWRKQMENEISSLLSSLKRNFCEDKNKSLFFCVLLLVIISLVLPSSITMCLTVFSYDFKRLKMKCVSAGLLFFASWYRNIIMFCLFV